MRYKTEVGVVNNRATARTTFYPCSAQWAGHLIPHAQRAGMTPVICAPHLKGRLPAG